MDMSGVYHVGCDCGTVKATLRGEPKVQGFCHCEDCRELLQIPYHSVTAWEQDQVTVDEGADQLIAFQHPGKRMKRFYCANCGETLFNSNAMDWRIVSQLLISKCHNQFDRLYRYDIAKYAGTARQSLGRRRQIERCEKSRW